MDELWDAVEIAERVRRKDVTASEVLEAAIRRAERAQKLGAVVVSTYDRARAAAALPIRGPLAGVPTYIKDLAQLRGVATGWGSSAGGYFLSRKSDRFVRRFEATGLMTLGKSATPELGLTATTEPLGRAPCRNPWDPTRSSGGSSGGAGTLVASGVVPIAHASDGGGSIRIPASCCGLVGFKPSRYRLDMEGSNLLPVNIASDGVVTRTVRDTIALYHAMEAANPPRRLEPVGRVAPEPVRPLRIGVFVDSPIGASVASEVRDATLTAARTCESLGHRVEQIDCPFDGAMVDDFLAYWGFVSWIQQRTAWLMMHRGFDAAKLERWSRDLAATFSRAPHLTARAIQRLRGFTRTYAVVMRAYDVLISPTVAHAPPPLGHLSTDLPFDTLFERLRRYVPFTPIQNTSGAPAISLPLGRSAEGLPIGVQLAGAHGADRTLLELSLSLEAAAPWPKVAPLAAWS